MQAVEPGTAQNIPVYAKIIILVLSLCAVVLTAAWGKLSDIVKSKKNNKRI
jgi:hypothetical protein